MELKNKVIAITGAAQGLGLAMAKTFADAGAHVAMLDMQDIVVKSAAEQISELGVTARGYAVNVTDESDVEYVFSQIKNDFGQLNGLINSAGIMRDGMLLKIKDGKVVDKMSKQQFQSVIDVNVTGTFLCAREAASTMIETNSSGVIINLSSVSRGGNMGQTNYSASKSAVATMTVTWAKELARYNIRTGCIAPGLVNTAMAAQMRPEMIERFLSTVPAGRLAEVEELGHAAKFIFENDYFTGRTLELDGGTRV
ncbi:MULTISPECIES: SDR family oxidoreductase [Alteromonadaceae]|uniref:SDR family oxidoreductase n=1 Tax=Alteromonadaceae TaxID=72275 RepID=UPI001C0984A3|nr:MULTISPECIES: SDR family oxidoreductase [Aliiglaciecola]MBU2877339.1 SDR family oxidoreductase [Aliiglaciecola lipolytica]MDO6712987.1 SDR family oxidoreductase [Aliiglaciecola sp. 2_MG-2023]MDO6754026.1 SDR family oxidoreductase [Aliiglaciecola sp. 1_MG-2023]